MGQVWTRTHLMCHCHCHCQGRGRLNKNLLLVVSENLRMAQLQIRTIIQLRPAAGRSGRRCYDRPVGLELWTHVLHCRPQGGFVFQLPVSCP